MAPRAEASVLPRNRLRGSRRAQRSAQRDWCIRSSSGMDDRGRSVERPSPRDVFVYMKDSHFRRRCQCCMAQSGRPRATPRRLQSISRGVSSAGDGRPLRTDSGQPDSELPPRSSARDVARLAGVSTATVSRAVNLPGPGRPPHARAGARMPSTSCATCPMARRAPCAAGAARWWARSCRPSTTRCTRAPPAPCRPCSMLPAMPWCWPSTTTTSPGGAHHRAAREPRRRCVRVRGNAPRSGALYAARGTRQARTS